jgi:hypothetical protein
MILLSRPCSRETDYGSAQCSKLSPPYNKSPAFDELNQFAYIKSLQKATLVAIRRDNWPGNC